MHGLQANGTFFRHAKHGIWEGSTVQELKSRVTQRHPLFQILRAPIRPGHARLSVQIRFHAFCPNAPNIGAVTPFAILWSTRSLDLKGSTAKRKARERNFPDSPKDRERCTRHRGRGDGVESPAPSTPLEWVKHSDDSGILLKRQQIPRNRGMNT
ncbi:hypothetical protein TNCT_177721 [Trichonephila clavata]|uniref:Uncharacterized protein n=1 Tax=Trichonephila clavata TaxID=2740835 RepID=A0A8X6LFV6_TRICU|nr:hypothetical protein TNCT_177721 [Trichonephila clavata]